MSDHEFEKRVQLQMDELKLRPSDAVWKGVEVNLRRDKRRRRTLLWIPVLGILLITGGYFVFSGTGFSNDASVAANQQSATTVQPSPSGLHDKSPANLQPGNDQGEAMAGQSSKDDLHNETSANDINAQPANENISTQTSGIKTGTQAPANDITPSNDRITSARKDNNAGVVDTKNEQPYNKTGDRPSGNRPGGDRNKQQIAQADLVTEKPDNRISNTDKGANESATEKKNDKAEIEEKDKQSGNRTDKIPVTSVNDDGRQVAAANDAGQNKDAGQDSVTIPVVQEVAKTAGTDSIKQNNAADSAARKATEVVSVNPKKLKKPATASKWQWGIMAAAGVTNVSEGGVFHLLDRARVDDLANAMPSYQGIPPAPTPQPSPIHTGPVFSVGAYVKRNISPRINISLGLQYSYWSAYTKVGQRIDSLTTVNFGVSNSALTNLSYRADNTRHDYTNRYHFVELPLSLGIKLNRSMRTPITFDAGVSFSRLVYTNALHFDGISRLYYENDDFFNKTQVAFNTNLSIGILQSRRHPVSIGPSFRYFATSLVKKEAGASGDQHLWSLGIQAKMLLKK